MVGGVNSPVRAFRHLGGEPLWLSRATGATVASPDGRRFLDFIMGWGALILGHNPPAVVRALRQALGRGALFGLTHPAEAELARLIAQHVPSVEQVRFMTSGTEACLTAVKLARAHTGRSKILAFDGGYHGHGESLIAGGSAGIPHALAREVVRVRFNDLAACERLLERFGHECGAIMVEPVAANMGVVSPEPGYLAGLRQLASRHGLLLIFDEVVTGFRLGLGGGQAAFGVAPDLTVFGKIIGGGLPIGALGGRRELMGQLAPEGPVYHGGTFAGHPLSMAGGIAALEELAAHPPYERLERLASRLAQGLERLGREEGVPLRVNRAGSMLTVFFSEAPVRHQADAKAARADRFARWARELLARGILIPPSPHEALFLSTAHTEAHVERLLRASQPAFAGMGGRS